MKLLVLVLLLALTQQQPIPPSIANPALKAIEDEVAKMRKAMEPPPPPVDCVVTDWELKSATAWMPTVCPATGIQNRDELWERTVTTPASNGGAACPLLQETRQAAQNCTPPGPPLLLQYDMTYDGAFRVPLGDPSGTRPLKQFSYGGTGLGYSGKNSLYLVGHDWDQLAAEISIPTPGQGAVATLPRAVYVQPFVDILQGKRITGMDGGTGNGVKIGGIMPDGKGKLVVAAWTYYDNAPGKLSHFLTDASFASLTPASVTGAFQVGTGWASIVPTAPVTELNNKIAGFVSGYMTTIPQQYQSELGGTHLTGNGGGVSIVTRTSSGPSATVFSAAAVGSTPTAGIVMGYPTSTSYPALQQPTLGTWGQSGTGGLYNGTQYFRGMVFPDGTRSVLFIGWTGTEFCYGGGTSDPALHLQPHPAGGHWCYDPTNSSKGTHGYPYKSVIYAYDVLDFIAVKKGVKKPWEVVPYTTWTFALPNSNYQVMGATYDPATKRLFMSAGFSDGNAPLIHVFRLPATRKGL